MSDDQAHTASGIPAEPFYRPESLGEYDYEVNLGDPGTFP